MAEPWHLWVDFFRVDADGLTHAHTDDLTTGVEVHPGDHLVVGDAGADPAVAKVIAVDADGAILLRVLPGHADLHRELVGQ